MSERWLPVVGYEGLYEVSDLGRVRSVDRLVSNGTLRRGKLLRPLPDRRGYVHAELCRNGKRIRKKVHRLVLEAFVGPCPQGMQARHFPDFTPSNNRLDNLSWATPVVDGRDRRRLSQDDIRRIFSLHEAGRTHREIAADAGLDYGYVGRILRGEVWSIQC